MSETNFDSDPKSLPKDLIQAANRLAKLMRDEVQLLESMHAEAIAAKLPDKRAAATAYRDLFGRMAGRPELLENLDPPTKADLKSAAGRLAEATQANARALQAGIEANAGLVRAIALAVQEAQLAGGRYLANGRLGPSGSAEQPPAVTVNQVL